MVKYLNGHIEQGKKDKQNIDKILANGDLNSAEQEISQYRKLFSSDVDGYSMSAILYYYKEEYDKAELEIEKIINKFPFNFGLNYNLAIVAFAKGDYEKALKYYYRSQKVSNSQEEVELLRDNIEYIIDNGLVGEQVALEILKRERVIFEFSYKVFPRKINKGTYVGDMLSVANNLESNLESYVAIYDYYLLERDGIFIENESELMGFIKTETLPAKYIKRAKLKYNTKHILPICIKNQGEKTELIVDENHYDLSKNIPERFYYYPIEKGNVKISSRNNVVLGNPIKMERNEQKPSLVMNIFVDGLSQTLIQQVGLRELMPNTYKYFSKGTICNNVHVTGEWTYVNMASFFTGDYITNHGMFHPNFNTQLRQDKLVLGEIFKKDGYFTAKIDGDWRSVPTYGYIRGIDRYIYQPAIRGMNLEEIITEVIEHVEAFKDTNKFLWTCISDLHDVADGYEARTMAQVNTPISTRFNEIQDVATSVRREFDENKIIKYTAQIKRLDIYLGLLFSYLESNYEDDEIVISLMSDHGQAYLVPEGKPFLSAERTKVPFMFRGKNVKRGICNELIEGIDLLPILLKAAEIKDNDSYLRDANLPKYFGGEQERHYTYTETIFPGSTYKVAINDSKHMFDFESGGIVGHDGRFELGNYKYKLINECNGMIETDSNKEKTNFYLKVIFEHVKEHIIY